MAFVEPFDIKGTRQVDHLSRCVVRPDTGVTVALGDVVIRHGASGDEDVVRLADASAAATTYGMLLIAESDAGAGEEFYGVKSMRLDDVDTNGSAVGDPVYLSDTPGGWSLAAGTVELQIGEVMVVSATAGSVRIDPYANYASAGVVTTGVTGTTFTVNSDAVAGSDEDPQLRLEGGDGAADVIRTTLHQDSSADRVWIQQEVVGGSRQGPEFYVGRYGETGNIDAVLGFSSGTGAANVLAAITLDATNSNWIFDGVGAAVSTIFRTGTDTGATDFQIQNNSGTALLTVLGSGNLTSALAQIDIDASAAISVNSSAGVLNIGNDNVAQAINVGTAGARDITVGSAAAASIVIDGGVGTLDIDADGAIQINSSAGALGLGNDNVGGAINVGTSGARTIGIGSAAATAINIDATTVSVGTGTLAFDGTAIDLDPTGTFDLAMDAAQTVTIHIADALDAAFLIQEAANNYIEVDTQNAAEIINLGNAVTNPALTQLGSGQVTFNGNVDAVNGLDVSVGAFAFTGTNIDLDPTGTFDLAMDAGQAFSVDINGAASNITLVATGAAHDLTISVTGAQNSSLILLAEGTTADALQITTTGVGGGMDISCAGDLDIIGTTTADFGDGTGAVHYDGAGALSLTGTTTVDIDGSGTVSLESSAGAINVGNDNIAQNVNIGTGGVRDINVGSAVATSISLNAATIFIATGEIDFTGTNIDLDPTGSFNLAMDAGQAFAVAINGAASSIALAASGVGQDLTIEVTGAVDSSLVLSSAGTGADAIDINATGAAGGITIDAVGGISLDAGGASNFTCTDGDALTLQSGASATWSLNGTGAGALVLTIDAINGGGGTGGLTLTADDAIVFGDGGNPTINYAGAGAVTATGNPTWDFGTGQADFGGNLDANAGLDVSGGTVTFTGTNVDFDPTGTVAIDMDAAQTFTITLPGALGDAFLIQEGANSIFSINTQTEIITLGYRVTTDDGVTAGTPRGIGGRAHAGLTASANVSNVHAIFSTGTYSVPTATMKLNTALAFEGVIGVTAISGGAATVQIRMFLDGTAGTLVFDTGALGGGGQIAANQLIHFKGTLAARTDCSAGAGTVVGHMEYKVATLNTTPAYDGMDVAGSAAGTYTVAMNNSADVDIDVTGVTDAAGTTLVLEHFQVWAVG